MKRIFTLLALAAMALTASAQKTIDIDNDANEVIRVWDNSKAPHSNEETVDEAINKSGHFTHTSETVFYLYKANKDKATGRAVVVLPGGGYSKVCIRHEGFALAKWFNEQGITALVVKYRLPNLGHKEVPLEDAQEALKYLHKHASKLGIDPAKVGICGSSAGGHLAAYTSNFMEDKEKPAFSILFYPVITGTTWHTHHNTFRYLLGDARTPAEQEYYSLENRVSESTPTTILLLSDDDRTVPPISSIRYYTALKEHGVKASMHIYPSGGHGWAGKSSFRYCKDWQRDLSEWIASLDEQPTNAKTKK